MGQNTKAEIRVFINDVAFAFGVVAEVGVDEIFVLQRLLDQFAGFFQLDGGLALGQDLFHIAGERIESVHAGIPPKSPY